MNKAGTQAQVGIRGDGIVGCCAALELSRLGLSVVLEQATVPAGRGAHEAAEDVRTYALNEASVGLLRRLRVWEALPPHAACPVLDMHIEGDEAAAQGAAPAGALHFSAWQQGEPALAWIVDAAALEAALRQAVRYAPHVQTRPGRSELHLEAELTLVCEGRDAQAREQLGVHFQREPYGHAALATRVVADRPHAGVASQWFHHPDVLALLPFDQPESGRGYGVVWSLPAERAQALAQAPEAEFEAALQTASRKRCGGLRLAGPRRTWPLMLGRVDRITGPGWALLGDAAHVVHPLAGQGLNLGLGDVISLAEVLAEREAWRSLGDERLLARHARNRAAPVAAMSRLTDGLWHLFGYSHPLAHELRNRGMNLLDRLPALKRQLAARALR